MKGGGAMKHLNFSVNENYFKRVKVDAALKGITVKDYLKGAVDFYLEKCETMKQETE